MKCRLLALDFLECSRQSPAASPFGYMPLLWSSMAWLARFTKGIQCRDMPLVSLLQDLLLCGLAISYCKMQALLCL